MLGRRWSSGLLACATGLALVAIADVPAQAADAAGSHHSAYVSGGTLTELVSSDPGNLDPLMTVTGVTRLVDELAYDPLVNVESDGKVVSGLATRWEQSGTTYTFSIRHGARCSDGSTMTPATIAANINFVGNPKEKSPLTTVFIPAGAKATANTSASKVKITLAKPFPFFLENLAAMFLECAKGLTHPAILANGTDGTGPYALTRAVPGDQYTFSIRKGYAWGPGGATTSAAGMPAKIVVKVVPDETTQADLLLDGGANLASVQGLAAKPLSDAHLFHRSEALPLGELWFNQGSGHATAATAIREAIVRALDLPEVGRVFSQELGSSPTGLVTVTPNPCSGNTVAGIIPSTNGREAKALLNAAGWKLGKNGVRTKDGKQLDLTLLYPTTIGGDAASAFELAAQELKNVGIAVKLVGDTVTELEGVIFGTGSWDITDVPIGISTPNEAEPFVSGPVPPNGENFSHIANSAYTALAAKATALPGTTGCPDWNNASKQLFKALDVVPFENASEPTWASGATFDLVSGGIPPTSLRLVKG